MTCVKAAAPTAAFTRVGVGPRIDFLYPPLPPITARTVSSGPKSSAPST